MRLLDLRSFATAGSEVRCNSDAGTVTIGRSKRAETLPIILPVKDALERRSVSESEREPGSGLAKRAETWLVALRALEAAAIEATAIE